ncbi:MAG: terminase family protein [Alphaproteobacteria bacterium]
MAKTYGSRSKMPIDDALEHFKLLADRKQFERWRYFTPTAKQMEFFATGRTHPERLLIAGNRLGKTEAAAYEISRHMTGEYPPWWPGKVYTRPVRVWAAGTSAVQVRETGQEKLCGPVGDPEMLGSGYIPKAAFVGEPTASRSAPNAYDSFQVRHKSGGVSRLVFKTYEQERRHWQGAEIDVLWPDEEPPMDLYVEGRTRLGGKGMTMMTFTPLFGMSDVVRRFFDEQDPLRVMVQYGIKDATFMTEEQREGLIAGYPLHEREARMNGTPVFGEGRIFRVPEEDLRIPAVPRDRIPLHWKKIWGLDFGINHPFAAVLLAWDTENSVKEGSGPVGTIYILASIRMKGAIPLQHADAIKKIAPGVPIAWPHDGHARDRGSGESLAPLYKAQGLNMMNTHATHPEGGLSTEAGVAIMDAYMQARQWKVFDNQPEWFQEYGQYHRKDGLIVKTHDDLMSASRIATMMRRYARPVPLGGRFVTRQKGPRMVDGVDFDLFG